MTRLSTIPLESKHLPAAGALLAARHKRDRERVPILPRAYEDADLCRAHIESELGASGALGVLALSGDEPVGFMVMSPNIFGPLDITAEFLPPRSTQVGYGAHAATREHTFDAYREMYAALAEHFVDRGYFDHLVYVAPGDAATNEAFVSLSFGRTLVAAIRDVGPVDVTASAAVDIHAASSEDLAVVSALNDELLDHHARSPIFWPHLQEPRPALDGLQRSLLEDPDTNAHFVAYQDGRPAGMNTFMAPDWINPLVRPDKTIYLYQGVVSQSARGGGVGTAVLAHAIPWARDHGYDHVALHYAAPNVPGARFWQSQGFHPIEYRLARHIDDRMAWAR